MFQKLRENLDALSREVRESVVLRCRLAMLELKANLTKLSILAVLFAFALVGFMTGVAVLAVWIAELLDECAPLYAKLWTMIVGLTALVVSLVVAWCAWRYLRRRWVGLEQTLEELREDIAWFKEWAGKEPTNKERASKEPDTPKPADKKSTPSPSEPASPAADPSGGEES